MDKNFALGAEFHIGTHDFLMCSYYASQSVAGKNSLYDGFD